jgi:hypothetical protein
VAGDTVGARLRRIGTETVPYVLRVLRAAGYETFHMGKRGNECVPALECYETNIIRDDPGPAERMNSSQAYADRVIQFLRERKTDRPFFLYLAPPVPHDPRVAPKEFMDLYDPAKIPSLIELYDWAKDPLGKRYGIGYAPDAWRALEAGVADYGAHTLVEAGLVIDAEGERRDGGARYGVERRPRVHGDGAGDGAPAVSPELGSTSPSPVPGPLAPAAAPLPIEHMFD